MFFLLPLLVQAKRRIHHFMWWCVRLCHIERLVLSERHMKGFVSPHKSQNSRILRLFHTLYCILKLCCFFPPSKRILNQKSDFFFSFICPILPLVPTFLSYRTVSLSWHAPRIFLRLSLFFSHMEDELWHARNLYQPACTLHNDRCTVKKWKEWGWKDVERSENMGKLAAEPGSCRLNFPCSFTLVSAHISVNVLAFMNLADKDFSVYQPWEGKGGKKLELGTCT